MSIMVGSARIDENGNISGGAAGDQKQSSTSDYSGEVSMQAMYTHSKGWYIMRPKSADHANKIAANMITACNNKNIGYDQTNRYGVVKNGVNAPQPTECDCSSLARECVKEATGKDPGDFTTANEVSALKATGLFEEAMTYVNQSTTPVYNGDILVTKTAGHTVVVVGGNPRSGSSSVSSGKLDVDGQMGVETTKRAQRYFGTPVDGKISNQLSTYKSICPGILSAEWEDVKEGGSSLVRAIQRWVGAEEDGYLGPDTIKKWQKKMGTTVDGVISNPSQCIAAFQSWLNNQEV